MLKPMGSNLGPLRRCGTPWTTGSGGRATSIQCLSYTATSLNRIRCSGSRASRQFRTIRWRNSLNTRRISKIARHIFPKEHLVKLFSGAVGSSDFGKIATYLRSYRFDIRSKETNIAIRDGHYMVAYPFNLPARRQMNFRVRDLPDDVYAEAV